MQNLVYFRQVPTKATLQNWCWVISSDGVGAGQVQEVNDTEVSAIQKVLKSEEMQKEVPGGIKLTFIIVSKRINTRYLSPEGADDIWFPLKRNALNALSQAIFFLVLFGPNISLQLMF